MQQTDFTKLGRAELLRMLEKLQKELETEREESFALAAQVCPLLYGDEWGHTTCKFQEEAAKRDKKAP